MVQNNKYLHLLSAAEDICKGDSKNIGSIICLGVFYDCIRAPLKRGRYWEGLTLDDVKINPFLLMRKELMLLPQSFFLKYFIQ